MLAILSIDAYNQGFGAGITEVGKKIGITVTGITVTVHLIRANLFWARIWKAGVASIAVAGANEASPNFSQGNQIRATGTFTRTDGTSVNLRTLAATRRGRFPIQLSL